MRGNQLAVDGGFLNVRIIVGAEIEQGALVVADEDAPGGGDYKAKAIPPGTHPELHRGKGSNVRHVHNIMPEDDNSAHSLPAR